MKSSYVLAGAIVVAVLIIGATMALGSGYHAIPDSTGDNADKGMIRCDVRDARSNGHADINLTLWKSDNGRNVEVVDVPAELNTSQAGIPKVTAYDFKNLPYGEYNITVEKDGYIWSRTVSLDGPIAWTSINMNWLAYATAPSYVNLTNGTIYGYVTDKNQDGIPGADVTAWYGHNTDTPPFFVNDGIARCQKNPVKSAEGIDAGLYWFEGLQSGWYNITAEIDGHMWFSRVNLTGADDNGTKASIAIPDYVNP